MNLVTDWKIIRKQFNRSFRQNLHVPIASLDGDNKPTITPIGSFFLNSDQTGFYFEKFPKTIPTYAKINPNICVIAVNSSKWFWLNAIIRGKFKSSPAIKLYGQLGDRRKATSHEIKRLNSRMKSTKGLRGNVYLWSNMEFVREITFTKAESIKLGKMTE
jgi:hypothetical protein